MTVKELYDHITKHMTAEQALLKLLEGSLIEYEKLKFSEEGKEIHPQILILMATCDIGWDVAIPRLADDNAEIPGLIIGTEEYIESLLDRYKIDLQSTKNKN